MTPRRDYRAMSVGFEYPSDEPPEFDTIALRTALMSILCAFPGHWCQKIVSFHHELRKLG